MNIYHVGVLFLRVFQGRALTFSRDEILAGEPRELALQIGEDFSFSLEKALRRHVEYRAAPALEF
ncbi:hypothetical protein [Rhodocyclus gracilis]|uniref:hypothetical protein n=1 Tax=Rhodocyclus gracilis TaxID=2929842 RepID=UPI00143152F2|nr:hypothetical protein [Rhodocyclus gracilis]